jgi:hypothetical protein
VPPRDALALHHPDVRRLHELAHQGELPSAFTTADRVARQRLDRALYAVVWPIVFGRITRMAEIRRGHRRCARGVDRLEPECVDRFHDDVAAVIAAVVERTTCRVADLPAWIASITPFAVVDAHRKRRGEVGALQRPRLPLWLRAGLRDDPWLTKLAVHVLEWVGVPATAGHRTWPLDGWATTRAQVTADWTGSTPEVVAEEVDLVLAVMRTRPAWHADHVERPLGRKQAPTAGQPGGHTGVAPLALTRPDDKVESVLTAAAHAATSAIAERIRRGEDTRVVVEDVVRRLFCGDVGLHAEQPPHAPAPEEWLAAQLHDRAGLDRIVAAVTGIVLDADDSELTG